jgi:hypothetical protein
VLVSGEEEQERIAAELEQAAAVLVRDPQELGERRVDHVRELLRAGLALLGESLRHRSEAREVDERERAREIAPLRLRRLTEPLDHDAGNVRRQVARRRGRRFELFGCDRHGFSTLSPQVAAGIGRRR